MVTDLNVKDFNRRTLTWFKDDLVYDERVYDKEDDNILFSSGADSRIGRILSYMYRCDIVVNGLHFNSVEQLCIILKYGDYPDVQRALLAIDNPKMVKNLHKRRFSKEYGIRKGAVSNGYASNVFIYALRLKYKCCEEFREEMRKIALERGNGLCYDVPELVEYCSYWWDPKGGCNDIDRKNWGNWKYGKVKGVNKSGRIMRRVFQEGFAGLLDAPLAAPYERLRLLGKPLEIVA